MKRGKLNHLVIFGPRISGVLSGIRMPGMTVVNVFFEMSTPDGGDGIPRRQETGADHNSNQNSFGCSDF